MDDETECFTLDCCESKISDFDSNLSDLHVCFANALAIGDDEFVLSLLGSSLISIHSPIPCNDIIVPPLFAAIFHERAPVIRALVALGADLNTFHPVSLHTAYTAVGYAVLSASSQVLALCHALGGRTAFVHAMSGTPPYDRGFSAVELAISRVHVACLEVLLDKVETARPLKLSLEAAMTLSFSGGKGLKAKPMFEALRVRGFDAVVLKEYPGLPTDCEGDSLKGQSWTFGDLLVFCAQQSGDKKMVKYIMKRLWVQASGNCVEETKASSTGIAALASITEDNLDVTNLQEVSLHKYQCVSCDVLAPTFFCSRCRVYRFCSKACQRLHWKQGHKKECKKLRQVSALPGGLPSDVNV